jgi:hypothetical protein
LENAEDPQKVFQDPNIHEGPPSGRSPFEYATSYWINHASEVTNGTEDTSLSRELWELVGDLFWDNNGATFVEWLRTCVPQHADCQAKLNSENIFCYKCLPSFDAKRVRNCLDVVASYGFMKVLDLAISKYQGTVELMPNEHPDKPALLNNLGSALLVRFEHLGNIADVDNAIGNQQAAVDFTLDSHPKKMSYLGDLGNTFRIRFLRSNQFKDAMTAISHLSVTTQSLVAPPTVRFEAVQQWISIASLIAHNSLMDAYEYAIHLMSFVTWLGLPLADQRGYLVRTGEITRNAVAAAISLERYDTALKWLEHGRSINWNRILQLSTPVDELRKVNFDLANRLVEVSRLLDSDIEQQVDEDSTEKVVQRYQGLMREQELIIKQVRSLPNFQGFLEPLAISRPEDAPQNGPVVVLNVAEERCDALVLIAGIEEVIHIPLPNITLKRILELKKKTEKSLTSTGIRLRRLRIVEDEDDRCDYKNILSELWDGLVKPVLDSLAFSVRIISPVIYNLVIILSLASPRCTSTYLVVSNRTTHLPSHTCSWHIRSRFEGFADQ